MPFKRRWLDTRTQSIIGIESLIPLASLTVDCRGVNISPTKPIWKLSNDKSACQAYGVRLRYILWIETACYCNLVARASALIALRSPWIIQLRTWFDWSMRIEWNYRKLFIISLTGWYLATWLPLQGVHTIYKCGFLVESTFLNQILGWFERSKRRNGLFFICK